MLGYSSPVSGLGPLPLEGAALVPQQHGDAAASAQVVPGDGDQRPARLGAAAGRQETHGWCLQKDEEKVSSAPACARGAKENPFQSRTAKRRRVPDAGKNLLLKF